MTGLDTSQTVTDQLSLHAEEAHLHSHPEESEDARAKAETAAKGAKAKEAPKARKG